MHARVTPRAAGIGFGTEIVEIYGFVDGLIADIDVYYKDTHTLVAALEPVAA
jgi:hypothetical protein